MRVRIKHNWHFMYDTTDFVVSDCDVHGRRTDELSICVVSRRVEGIAVAIEGSDSTIKPELESDITIVWQSTLNFKITGSPCTV